MKLNLVSYNKASLYPLTSAHSQVEEEGRLKVGSAGDVLMVGGVDSVTNVAPCSTLLSDYGHVAIAAKSALKEWEKELIYVRTDLSLL